MAPQVKRISKPQTMENQNLLDLLKEVRAGAITVEVAMERLRELPYEDLGFARLDHHRAIRQGFPEVIFCQGKAPDQVAQIMTRLVARNDRILATRADSKIYRAVKRTVPDAVYYEPACCITVDRRPNGPRCPGILIVTGGTSDIPVAEEAVITAELMGHSVERLYDVGVAGIHRLLGNMDALQRAQVIISVAGMEGALASVVGGLVSVPVIAVPTSVGYGASFGGLAPLLAMLNSCASGVAVVNIDNGFGAGYLAATINAAAWGSERRQQ